MWAFTNDLAAHGSDQEVAIRWWHLYFTPMPTQTLYTIGHSNLSIDEFLALLKEHSLEALVDIRRFPSSRAFPQFNREPLSRVLLENGLEYHWIESLGGRRAKTEGAGSRNSGLHNASFRNYADYMETASFLQGMNSLWEIQEAKRTAIMCAESVFWRCHRRLVSDFVVARGGSVQHIFPSGELRSHSLTPSAQVTDGQLTYPGQKTLFE